MWERLHKSSSTELYDNTIMHRSDRPFFQRNSPKQDTRQRSSSALEMYNDELQKLMENLRQRSEARDENKMTLPETAVQGPFATEQPETENLSLVQAAAKNDGAQGFSPCAKSSRKRAASESMMQQAERGVRRKNDIEPKNIFGHPLKREGPPKEAETLRGKEDRRACVLESGLHTSDGDTIQEGTQDDFGGYVDKGRSAGELTEEVIIRKEFA
ncbi:hypothetical protein CcaCcLH18_14366 [Colletotrichum camelliae]|nr:hypothetical protein CcaCcLH18_14366 [Colletotrichum camelliae]